MERKPHFFKVLLGDFSQRLKIPVEFMKNISNEASKRVTLQGPSGNCWHADFSKTSKDTFLCGGWADFAKDHALREFEFLVFRYDGDFHFTVMVFDRTACEREDLFTTSPKKRRNEGKDKPGRPVTTSSDFGSHLRSRAIKKELQEDNVNVSPLGPGVVQGNCFAHSETHKDAKIKLECDEPSIEMISSSSETNKKSCSRKRRLQAQEAAYAFTSKFPYTVVRMGRSHVQQPSTMKLPRAFSHHHLPLKRTTMILKDPNRKPWVVTYIPVQGDRDRLSRGWLALYRANNLKKGLLFEAHLAHSEAKILFADYRFVRLAREALKTKLTCINHVLRDGGDELEANLSAQKIPVEFMKNISIEASKRVTLQGPSGNCWHADFGKTSKGTFLCGGWADFAKDHALREFEFLVFRYDGNFQFTVMVFDTTACEREDLFTTSPDKRHNEGKDKPGKPVTSSSDIGSHLRSRVIKKQLQEDSVSPLGPGVVQGDQDLQNVCDAIAYLPTFSALRFEILCSWST
ncbi:hypothetical protein J5N97_019386 [Dioscorea zingiberensis]|uniref:TF-B3 domain-containing protein n=1 Tax=Dioscorea zingiberensis TaxID=325984 RepID=A0A9D5CEZ3_9LILI|nr:hypothetical protein J5N97_019386 [Dioscorea zingiberensis]